MERLNPGVADRLVTFLAASLVVFATASGCGDSATEPLAPTPDPPRPTTVTVNPATAQLTGLGAAVQLSAEVRDQSGNVMAGAAVAWSSTAASVATVDAAGLVTAAGNGSATITATSGSASGSAAVTVEQALRVPAPDRAALVALYEATGGPNWSNSDNWLSDAPLGEWHGVETDGVGRVVSLELVENRLAGAIPSELGDLAALEHLDLGGNGLTGPIPPELGRLSRLKTLYLNTNRLTGTIPTELGGLVNLEDLRLARNGALAGTIPAEFGRLSKLEGIWLSNTGVSGPIPAELGNLSNLWTLWIDNNDLSGPIPPELGRLSHLGRLALFGNRLTGPVPPELGNLTSLVILRLEHNRLTGPFPPSVLGITGLEHLRFQENAGLCVPGTTGFVAWAAAAEQRSGPFCNEAGRAGLEALYGSAGGDGWTNSEGWLTDAAIGEWHGVTADSLGQVTEIDLAGNGLAGLVPPELGDLGHLTALRLGSNALSGRLPQSLARVPLREFLYAGTELCAPPAAPFREWLADIELQEGTGTECAPVSDRDALTALYEATDGPNWTNSQNWLTDAPLDDWHGVDVDGEGRVDYLDLSDNGLTGSIPSELGDLSHLERLFLRDNRLEGEIPPELGNLTSLTYLNLWGNTISGPLPPELGNLSNLWDLRVANNRLTGPIPSQVGNLSNLRRLYAGGNRLTGPLPPELGRLSELEVLGLGLNPLTGPIPPELGNLLNLRHLGLGRAIWWAGDQCDKRRHPDRPVCYPSLTGAIPRELGSLSNLEFLDLGWHDLSGPIPAALGNLGSLRVLRLESNRLSGSIPPEIGNLSSLTELLLAQNRLTGPVPSTIGGLSSLERLALSRNELTGALPPELGHLSVLRTLDAEYNALSGRIPPQLGRLADLEELVLGFNDLAGSVPAEFGRLASLRKLIVTANAALSGALPDGLAGLGELEFLAAGGTGLCAPPGAGLEAWLAALSSAHVATCGGGAPAAYLVQAVQSRDNPVPLVAGDDALARVFPTAVTQTDAGIPPVRVRFYIDGRETHVENIAGKPGPIPTEVDEGSLETSANAVISGSRIQPGLEMVVEIDPDGTLDPSLGVARRIPETGRLAVDVRTLPKFRLTVVPFLSGTNPDSTVLDIAAAMAADPLNHELLWKMHTLLPIADDYELTVHDPVVFTPEVFRQITLKAEAIRVMEGSDNYHMGMMTGDVVRSAGANTGYRTIGALPDLYDDDYNIIPHEFGHNMTLGHGPGCFPGSRDPWTDPAYPYSTGVTGVWGYDFRDGGTLVQPTRGDVMAFCGGWVDNWISDYHFVMALRHRLRYDVDRAAAPAAPTASLLLWGGVDAGDVPFLEPAFAIDAPPALPDSGGQWEIAGRGADGRELFSLSFAMPHSHEDEGAGFAFALPARPGWANALASITLEGPSGSFTLDRETDLPMSIVRDPRTGQVRGFLRDPPATTTAAWPRGRGLDADRIRPRKTVQPGDSGSCGLAALTENAHDRIDDLAVGEKRSPALFRPNMPASRRCGSLDDAEPTSSGWRKQRSSSRAVGLGPRLGGVVQ